MIANRDPVLLLLREASRKRICPGGVICASRQGVVRYDHAVGYASLYPVPLPLVATAVFDVASLTKAVATTAAVMLLIDAGDLDLDLRISGIFPVFKKTNKSQITVRHLLNHCSGLPAHVEFFKELNSLRKQGEGPAPGPDSVDWVVEKIAQAPAIPIETQNIYSDLGFMLLGRMIEKITEQPLDQFCREQIFLPLGMESTFYLPLLPNVPRKERLRGRQIVATEQCPWRGRLLRGEVHDDNCSAMGGVAGHAGLFSTTHDLHRFALTLLRCSKGESNFFSPAVVQEFWRKQDRVVGSTWALGWDTPSLEGSQAGSHFSCNSVGHLGFTGCSMWIDRDADLIVIFLSNRVHPSRDNPGITQLRPVIHNVLHSLLTQRPTLHPPPYETSGEQELQNNSEIEGSSRPVLHPPPNASALSFEPYTRVNSSSSTTLPEPAVETQMPETEDS